VASRLRRTRKEVGRPTTRWREILSHAARAASALVVGCGSLAPSVGSDGGTDDARARDARTGETDARFPESDAPAADASTPPSVDDASGSEGGRDCQGGVTFTDPAIEAAVRLELDAGPGPISVRQAGTISELIAADVGSLDGVQCLVNLQTVILQGGAISDLSPLAGLAALSLVEVPDNLVTDLTPLSNHPSLMHIVAPNNRVRSLAGLVLPVVSLDSCNGLILDGNPLGADAFTYACSQGWYSTWGGADGIDAGSCGNQDWCKAQGGK
jgi:hypothetical protein